MQEIRINAEEAEKLKRQHIQHELLDYRYYVSKKEWLDEKIELLDHKLDGKVGSVPLGSMGTSNVVSGDWIVQAIHEQDELIAERNFINKHIETVQSWFALLDEDTYEVVHRYVIVANCTGVEECAKELKLRNGKALLRIVTRAISEIAENI